MEPFESRRKKVQAIMKEKNVAALQVTSRENYYYLTGDMRNVARLFLPQEGEPSIIVFDEEVEPARQASGIQDVRGWRTPAQLMQNFFQLVKQHSILDKKVGFCVHSNSGFLVYKFLRSNPRMTVIENEEILMPLRYVKTTDELAAMRRAAEAADKGIEAATAAIKPGITEIEVGTEAEYAMRRAGAMRYGSSTFVDSGPHSIYLHGGTSRRKIENGDLVVIDVHPVVDMYSSDCARTVVCGQPSSEQRNLMQLYSQIQQSIIQQIKPRWKVGQVTKTFTEAFTSNGYNEQWIPGPVHGVGLEFEEWPHPSHYFGHVELEIAEDWTLAIGHSILPVKTVGGVKFEDTIQVTAEGGRSLNRPPIIS
ncbi:MAG TPA: Xaa-Pro peptidase family protein [Candidatus Sulfotelmatobacter sp.]|nr:Xaa-Pro peptidase family protein [Candidatus Sulfotelmatobacter sp.]